MSLTKTDFMDTDALWKAVAERDSHADSQFFYAVRTTGIYCRPSCKSRTPKRDNVLFYSTALHAQQAGFRACKKCNPDVSGTTEYRQRKMVLDACRFIEESEEEPKLRELADAAGLSPSYFNRMFKSIAGVTPKQYAIAYRSKKAAALLKDSPDITTAIYDAGFNASSRFYEATGKRFGMTASQMRKGGEGLEIRYSYGETEIGMVIVAATNRGICSVMLGTGKKDLLEQLSSAFPDACLTEAETGSDYEEWVLHTIRYLDDNSGTFDLPLDIAGTVFQERVWRSLMDIPHGKTVSYAELAEQAGNAKAVRAVASACAANRIAVIIPCHRVVRSDGSPSGYRWGTQLKQKLINREQNIKKGGV